RHVRGLASSHGELRRTAMREISFQQALDEAMAEEMQRDPRIFALATVRNPALEKEFGDKRVRFTPISEAAFTGIGLGAAGNGFRPAGHSAIVTVSFLPWHHIVNHPT